MPLGSHLGVRGADQLARVNGFGPEQPSQCHAAAFGSASGKVRSDAPHVGEDDDNRDP
jgi:hypothetical protein